ncbi:MAG: YHS domain-containing protein [Pirellulaceae bacterium]|jgi:YHS domain-containing protein
MHIRYRFLWFMALPLLLLGADHANKAPQSKEQLQQLQEFVGQWRGVGQLRRGSTQGAWQEKSEWKWSFGKEETALVFESEDGKYFQAGKLRAGDKANEYSLTVTTADEKEVEYNGKLGEDGALTLTLDQPPKDYTGPTSVAIRQFAKGARLVVQLHKSSPTGRAISMGTIGYTKIGSNFGKGLSYVECVVTGGKGTIPVVYMGKTYYVCCGGCRDYFNDDPKLALEEYYERKAEEKKEAEKNAE